LARHFEEAGNLGRPDNAVLDFTNGSISSRGINNHFILKLKPLVFLNKKTPHLAEQQDSLDLLHQPPKSLDLWRIEGEDPDLHLHRSNLNFHLIHLRTPVLVISLENLVVVLSLITCLCVVKALGASNLVVDVCFNFCVKVTFATLRQPLSGV
jgi:hypothetical protein